LTADTVAVREIPTEFAPGGALQPSDFEAVSGARLAVPMRRGEALLPGMLLDAESNGLSARLKPGSRALTISVDEVNSLSGMLQPGDRIDLMLSLRPSGPLPSTDPEVTRTLMQDVLVLATGRQVRPEPGDGIARTFTAITVEVDPGDAQKLVVAQRNGRLTAMLRNHGDRTSVSDRKLDVNGLLGIKPAAAVPTVRPRTTEVIVGGRGTQSPSANPGVTIAAAVTTAATATGSRVPPRDERSGRLYAPFASIAPGGSEPDRAPPGPATNRFEPTPLPDLPEASPPLFR
jgi:pilus assembly protein CpaB